MFKKLIACAVMLCCMTACSSQDIDLEAVSKFYSDMTSLTLEASITTNSGAVICYDILFTRNEEGDKVTILSPESLAGITAGIYPDKTEIVYEDVAVETLLPGISGYVPADAVTGMIKDLGQTTPNQYGFSQVGERDALAVTFADEYEGLAAEKTIWLDPDDYSLIKGEFFLDGMMIMELQVKTFVE